MAEHKTLLENAQDVTALLVAVAAGDTEDFLAEELALSIAEESAPEDVAVVLLGLAEFALAAAESTGVDVYKRLQDMGMRLATDPDVLN